MNRTARLPALDTLRGLLIVLMIAEHARQILGGGARLETPANPIAWLPADGAALVRLLSHLCAPGFFLLLGIGMVLHVRQHGTTPRETRIAFIRRGLLLIALQLTVENLGWAVPAIGHGGPGTAWPLYLGVLFGLGGSLILASLLFFLRAPVLFALAAGLLATSLVPLPDAMQPWLGWLAGGVVSPRLEILYPLLPWTGITLLGILVGRFGIRDNRPHLPMLLAGSGACAVALAAWLGACRLAHAGALAAAVKYPPSPAFVLATLALVLLLLAGFAAARPRPAQPLGLLGRHALAIYLVHLYALGLLARATGPLPLAWTLVGAAGVMALAAAWSAQAERSAFDRVHPHYDRFMHRFGLYRGREIRRALSAQPPGSLLDVGGGTGYLASQVADLFTRAIVVDSSAGMLSQARRRNLETCQASALDLPFPAGSFDAIRSTDALHHIKEADRAIAEMARVLKPGGVMVILEFHIRGPVGWLLFWFERLFIDRSVFISPAALESCMSRHGVPGTARYVSRLEYIVTGRKAQRSTTP